MCGFVALISPGAPIADPVLALMRDRLAHRGPDNASSWVHGDRRVGLAHRRLSIIDTSHHADQPMAALDGQLVLVYNGEIYNYIELREELKAEGYLFRTNSDTEVLLAAYAHWGDRCVERFNGMFAFALWDARRAELFVARDRFGEKPLFIGRAPNGTVALASEMKAILAHPDFIVGARMEALNAFSKAHWYEDGRDTFFDGIERLPPAHALKLGADGAERSRWRYWTPDYNDVDESIKPADAIGRFEELLARSVKMRLRADVAIGSSLSGGLDSSTIVGVLAKERGKAGFVQNTFSACFDEDPTMSEGPQIDEVVNYTGVTSHKVRPSATGLEQESMRMHWHQEEPVMSASIYLQWCVARLARENQTTVLLDGQGADELLAGYQFWFKQFQLDMLDRRQFWRAGKETYLFNRRLRIAAQGYQDSGRRFNAATAYSLREVAGYALARPGVWHGPYTEGLVKPVPGLRLRRTLGEALLYNSLPMLLRYADRNSMAFSRESRLPFLDYDLVDFCMRLPDNLLIRDGWQKWVLRQAAGASVPSSIRWRADKVGYAAPLDHWLRGSLKGWAEERLFSSRLRDIEGYDRAGLQQVWDAHQAGQANNSWAIWRWVSMAEWFGLLDGNWWKQPL